jgi:hypothetical protein
MAFLTTCHEDDSLGGGRHRALISIKPRAFRNGAMGGGALERIVHAWEQGDIARPHVINRAGMPLRMDGDGFLDIYPTREPDRYLSIGAPYILQGGVWTKVNLGPATRTANRISWTTAQADISVTFGGHFVEVGRIELKGGWVPPNRQVAIPVGLTGLTRSGGVLLRDGVPVLTMRPPHVEDMDDPMDVRPVAHEFVNVAGQNYVLLTLPTLETGKRWLLDPTLVLQPDAAAGKDNFLYVNSGTFNYGAHAGLIPGAPGVGIIGWDVSSILSTAACTAATMILTQYYQNGSTASMVSVYSIAVPNAAWVEGTKGGLLAGANESCWNALAADGAGGVTTSWAGSVGLGTINTDYEPTVLGSFPYNSGDAIGTTYAIALLASRVSQWFGLINANYGLKIPVSGAAVGGLAASDHATPAYRPQLTVDYTLPTGRGLKGLLNRSIL